MAEITQINPNLTPSGKETKRNGSLAHNRGQALGSVTMPNPHIVVSADLLPGTWLCGKYQVIEKMEVTAGEADLYLCRDSERSYAAKVYRREDGVKDAVSQQLQKLDSPYVAKVYETARYHGVSVEILPYYSRGSLQGKTFSYEQLREFVIPCLNEGLKALHDANIIHKDLKPANIMLSDEGNSVAIIDFGISSVTETGSTVVVTKTGMTPEYSAPETFKGLFLTQSDYYSLGVTLYELFCGKTPYNRMTPEEIEQYLSIQRIPFPKEMPLELQELIKALTYYDISNRRDKQNPNRRWGYEEVRKWLSGVRQTIPGEGVDRRVVKPYSFGGQEYTTRRELVCALVQDWNGGKKELFRGMLSEYFRICDPEAFSICQEAENEALRTSGKDDWIFWKTMYALEPEMNDFFWKGRSFAGLPALGRTLLEQLSTEDSGMKKYMDSLFRESILSRYAEMKDPGNETLLSALKALEASYRVGAGKARDRQASLYLTAYLLSGQHILRIAGQEFHTIDELSAHMKKLLGGHNGNLGRLREFCHILTDSHGELDPQFESWLMALGKREELESWKEAMRAST